jgi:hypothetical protein
MPRQHIVLNVFSFTAEPLGHELCLCFNSYFEVLIPLPQWENTINGRVGYCRAGTLHKGNYGFRFESKEKVVDIILPVQMASSVTEAVDDLLNEWDPEA